MPAAAMPVIWTYIRGHRQRDLRRGGAITITMMVSPGPAAAEVAAEVATTVGTGFPGMVIPMVVPVGGEMTPMVIARRSLPLPRGAHRMIAWGGSTTVLRGLMRGAPLAGRGAGLAGGGVRERARISLVTLLEDSTADSTTSKTPTHMIPLTSERPMVWTDTTTDRRGGRGRRGSELPFTMQVVTLLPWLRRRRLVVGKAGKETKR